MPQNESYCCQRAPVIGFPWLTALTHCCHCIAVHSLVVTGDTPLLSSCSSLSELLSHDTCWARSCSLQLTVMRKYSPRSLFFLHIRRRKSDLKKSSEKIREVIFIICLPEKCQVCSPTKTSCCFAPPAAPLRIRASADKTQLVNYKWNGKVWPLLPLLLLFTLHPSPAEFPTLVLCMFCWHLSVPMD